MKALLFDFGGTLDTNGIHWSENLWDAYNCFDISFSKEEFTKAYIDAEQEINSGIIKTTDGMKVTLFKQITSQWNILAQSHRELKENNASMIARLAEKCYFDVRETVAEFTPLLNSCKKKYKTGIVSNFYGNLEVVCKELSIDTYFDCFIDSAVVGVRKPDPKIFQLAIASLHVFPAETYVIGDSYDRDIVPAKELGCVTVWLCGKSWNKPGDISCADYVILSLAELKTLLRLP